MRPVTITYIRSAFYTYMFRFCFIAGRELRRARGPSKLYFCCYEVLLFHFVLELTPSCVTKIRKQKKKLVRNLWWLRSGF